MSIPSPTHSSLGPSLRAPRALAGAFSLSAIFRRRLRWDTEVIPVVVLLVVAVILARVTHDEHERAHEAEYRLLAAHARNTGIRISDTLGQVEQLLSHVASERLKYRALPHGAFAALLKRQRQGVPALGALLVTDGEGRILAATDAALIGRDVSTESYFVAQRDGGASAKLFLSRPDKRLYDDAVTAVFSFPVVGPDRTFAGVVGVGIGFDFFPRLLQTVNPDDSASMGVIFNRDGDLLFRRDDPEKYFGFNITRLSKVLKAHFQAGERTSRHVAPSHRDGKPRLFFVRDIGDSGLGLILSRQQDEVLAQWRKNVAVHILIFVFTAVLVMFLARVAARRKRELQAGKEFTELLIATANAIVIGVDMAGRITIFNQTAERILGYRRDEVLGRDWLELAAAPTPSAARGMLDAFRGGGALPDVAEYPIMTRSGEEHIIAWQNSIIPGPRVAIFIGIDVTERKRMEDALALAKRKAEEANRAKSRFLAAASHDLRQPIQALGLFTGALHALAQRPRINGPEVEHIATRLQSASYGLSNLLNELLDVSRLDAGAIRAEKRPIPLREKLATLRDAFSGLATEKGLELRVAPCSLWVDTDPALLHRILTNLVANALRYTSHGRVLLGCRRRPGRVTIQVWDTGIGIPADQHATIFEEFFQADDSRHHQAGEQGLGLGLSIAQRCAALLGTHVRVCSTPGQGSVFSFELPTTAPGIGVPPAPAG